MELDSEMKEASLEGLSVLIRGHYLYSVRGSWLVSSQQSARLAATEAERKEGKGGGTRRSLRM